MGARAAVDKELEYVGFLAKDAQHANVLASLAPEAQGAYSRANLRPLYEDERRAAQELEALRRRVPAGQP